MKTKHRPPSRPILEPPSGGPVAAHPKTDFLRVIRLLLPAGILPAFVCASSGAGKPNVIVLFADDLGYADVGYHGSEDMRTPNIDSIAHKGVRFSAGYVTAPVCGPSRAGLRTGVYQNRYGAEDNPGPYKAAESVKIGIPTAMRTMSERMKELGYATGMVGKSHTGNAPEFHPNASGYDEFFGFINGASNYVADGRFGTRINQPSNPIMRNRDKVEETDYLTDAFGREAAAFIERHKNGPFFLYVPFNAIHGPLQATDDHLAKFPTIKDRKRRLAAAMNYAMDLNIGRILGTLRKHAIEGNTLVIFLSDNGGKPGGNASFNTPLRGQKGELWDGGIRVPFCLQWPERIPGGRTIEFPVISLDILPTVVAAAGGTIKSSDRLDGINLLAYLGGEPAPAPQRHLFWRFNRRWAVRDAGWKLVTNNAPHGAPQLFHISEDIGETTDLFAKRPQVAARLRKAFDEWEAQLMPKQWGWDKSFPVHDPAMGGENR